MYLTGRKIIIKIKIKTTIIKLIDNQLFNKAEALAFITIMTITGQ